MKKYLFEINLLVGSSKSNEKGRGHIVIDTITKEVMTKFYREEIIYEVIDNDYEAAKNKALIHAHEQVRSLAIKEGRFSAFFLSCENHKGEEI